MSTPGDPAAIGPDDRPVPDTADLRILAELINNDWIPLGQAAFNARMSMQEAAVRLATMASRGLPLRLIAEGDRRALWQIAQTGPATGGLPDRGGQAFAPPADLLSPGPAAPAFPVASPPIVTPYDQAAAPAFPPAEPPVPAGAPLGEVAPIAEPSPVPNPPLADSAQAAPAAGPGHAAAPTGGPQYGAAPTGGAGYGPAPAGGPGYGAAPTGGPGYGAAPTGGPGYGAAPTGGPGYGAAPVGSPSHQAGPSGGPGYGAAPVVGPGVGGPVSQPPGAGGPVPPTGPVPPHEQAIAGAVPLGDFPFGLTGAAPADTSSEADRRRSSTTTGAHAAPDDDHDPEQTVRPPSGAQPTVDRTPDPVAAPAVDPGPDPLEATQTWGLPGSAEWARSDEQEPAAAAGEPTPAPEPPVAPAPPAPAAAPRVLAPLRTVGIFGEHLVVQVTALVDPADTIVTATGLRLDTGERAVLVRTTVQNASPIDHSSLPDQFLSLLTHDGRVLPKAALAVPGHPVHRVGIPAGTSAEGWTLFLVPESVTLQAVRWDVRPEAGPQTLHWPL